MKILTATVLFLILASLTTCQEANQEQPESILKDDVAVEDYTNLEDSLKLNGAADIFETEPDTAANKDQKDPLNDKDFQKKMGEFNQFQDFFCMMGLQKFITQNKDSLNPIIKSTNKLKIQKLAATLFGKCSQEVFSAGMLEAMLKFKSAGDIDKIDFPFMKDFNLEAFLTQSAFALTKEDEKILKRFDKAQKRMEKLAHKRTRGTADADDDDQISEEESQNSGKSKEGDKDSSKKPKKAIRYSSWLYIFVFAVVISLLVFLSWSVLGSEKPVQTQKKKKKAN